MKAFFLLLLVAMLAAGIWLVAPNFDTSKYFNESNRKLAFDRAEHLLTRTTNLFHITALETLFEEKMGECRVMTLPDMMKPDPRTKIVPIPGAHFPFAEPVILAQNGLLCGAPGHGKSILFLPFGSATITLRRQVARPILLEIPAGNMAVISDALELALDVGPNQVLLQSQQPVTLSVQVENGTLLVSLRRGKLDVSTMHKAESLELFVPVMILPTKGASIFTEGKLLSAADPVRLLPAGFQVVPSPGPAPQPAVAPLPPPVAPPAPSVTPPQAPAASH